MDFHDDDQETSGKAEGSRGKKYHRHTPRQIQTLEAMFKECPHPDENQRAQLSRELGLEARQIKFWFQNRRTQMKSQHERADNMFLRSENDKIRIENIAMSESLKNVICPNCGGPPVAEDYFDEQKLRMENARLKEELDRISNIAAKHLGRPFSTIPQGSSSISSLELSMGGMGRMSGMGGIGGLGLGGPSLDLDLLSGGSSGMTSFNVPPPVTEMERPMMAAMAARAMDELIRLAQAGDQLWVKLPGGDGREVLDVKTYDTMFTKAGSSVRRTDINVEGSRHSGHAFMGAAALADVFMDPDKWMEFFPTVVSNARILDILVTGGMNTRSESLILMHQELHIMTPTVPTRELSFLRYCRQIDQGLWGIADVSVDTQRDVSFGAPPRSRRRPSGCLISDVGNGYSKVIWVEHMEVEQRIPIHALYRDTVLSGAAFGAQRWVGALQRACERFQVLLSPNVPEADIAGVTPEGKRNMMKLSERMVSSLCESLTASTGGPTWTTMAGANGNDVGVRVSMHRSTAQGQPSGVVLSAATSVWLPVPYDLVFAFVRDENNRHQWDVLTHGNRVQEVFCIPNGPNPGNCISLLRGLDASQTNMLVLQESATDESCALVVYSPIDVPAANVVMSGEDPASIPLLPSGFTILPDGRAQGGAAPVGSVVTVVFQILVSSLPSSRLNGDSIATISGLINSTVEQIKAALNCG